MVDPKDIVVGATFRIVDQWVPDCRQNDIGKMDRYLGTICEVKKILGHSRNYKQFRIWNDQGDPNVSSGWIWNQHCIEYLDDEDVQASFDAEDFTNILAR